MMGNPLRFPHKTMLCSSPPLACMTGVVLFCYYMCMLALNGVQSILTVQLTWWLLFTSIWVHLQLLMRSVLLIPFVLCVLFCILFILCVAYPILPEYLDCAFLITAAVLSNIYLGSAYRFFFQFRKHAVIMYTKNFLACVTLIEFGYPVYVIWTEDRGHRIWCVNV